MTDDLIERIAAELLSLGWFPTRHRESALSAAERVLAVARPAILEELSDPSYLTEALAAIGIADKCQDCGCQFRSLAHTTGQEG